MRMIRERLAAEAKARPAQPDPDPARTCPFTAGWAPSKRRSCRTCIGMVCVRYQALGLCDDGSTPLPTAERPRCGATTRQGHSCRNPVVPGKRRCRLHGGLSTGPKTEAGRQRIARAQRARWAT